MRVTADPRACPGTGCCHRGILRSAHRPRLVDTIDTAIFSRRRAAGQTGLTSEAMRDYRSSTSFRRVQSLPWTPSLTVTMPANTNKAMMPTSTNVITEIDSFLRKRVAHSAARPNRGCVARTRGERRDDRGHHPRADRVRGDRGAGSCTRSGAVRAGWSTSVPRTTSRRWRRSRRRLAGGQQQLDLGVGTDDAALAGPSPLPIVASRMEPSSRGEPATVEHASPPVGTPPRHRGGAQPGARPLDRPHPPA